MIHAAVALSLLGAPLDCNANGAPDEEDVRPELRLEAPASFVASALEGGFTDVVARDLDGDRDLDLAVATRAHGIGIFLNDGSAVFEAAGVHTVSPEAWSLSAADLDGDGDLDLAAATRGSCCDVPDASVSVLLNRGDGVFQPAKDHPVPEGPSSLVAGDLDGDGLVDLAIACEGDRSFEGGVAVLWGSGKGTFEPSVTLLPGSPVSLAAADFDGDGGLDLVVASEQSSLVSLLESPGKGRSFVHREIDAGMASHSVVPADLDADGHLDLVLSRFSEPPDRGRLVVLWNGGDAGFARRTEHSLRASGVCRAAGDLDQDGDPDLVFGSTILLNDGAGGLVEASTYDGPFAIGVVGPAIGDLDGDGDLDLATPGQFLELARGGSADWLSVVTVMANIGGGRFSSIERFELGGTLGLLAVADLDLDGRVDVIGAGGDSGEAAIAWGDSSGGFVEPAPGTHLTRARCALAEDLNGDGYPDLVLLNTDSGALSVRMSRQDRTFGDPHYYPAGGFPPGSGTVSIGSGDLEGDGDLDLVVPNPGRRGDGNTLTLCTNRGDGLLDLSPLLLPGRGPRAPVVADLDGDFDADLAVLAEGSLWITWNRGDGVFSRGRFLHHLEALHFAAADMDADGLIDFAVSLSCGLALTRNLGGGEFAEGACAPLGPGPLLVSDLDMDGFPEVLHLPGDRIRILSPSRDLSALDPVASIFQSTGLATVRDVDADGDTDVVFAAGVGVGILRNASLRARSLDLNLDGVPDECQGASFLRGDSNTDGHVDVRDPVLALAFLFVGKPSGLSCEKSADANDDGALTIDDAVFLLQHLFLGGPPPGRRADGFAGCGRDLTPDALTCDSFNLCP